MTSGRGTLFLLLLLLALSQPIFAENASEPNITRFLNLNMSASCPGNMLHISAIASDGRPAPDVELRLVLYLPYMGFRGLGHTDSNGNMSIELTKNGSYRVYMNTDAYDHDRYVEFDYPALCPPPPPKQMNISVLPDCDNALLTVITRANDSGLPLEGVFILADNWSSFTGTGGFASLPFEKGWVYVRAERANYTSQEFFADARCLPPPECALNSDCDGFEFCGASGDCENVTGACGYAENHSWIMYACCEDADCGNESLECKDNACIEKQLPPELPANITGNANVTNESNTLGNESGGAGEQAPQGFCAGALIILSVFLFRACGQGHPPYAPS